MKTKMKVYAYVERNGKWSLCSQVLFNTAKVIPFNNPRMVFNKDASGLWEYFHKNVDNSGKPHIMEYFLINDTNTLVIYGSGITSDYLNSLLKLQHNTFLKQLLYEFNNHIRNQLYSKCQFSVAARSNSIEGNTLTEEDTATLFETQQIPNNEYSTKHIEEAQGHFLMFNEMLKTIDKPLSQKLIKQYHKALTEGIFEFKANGGKPGEYKIRKNIAGTSQTADPKDVPKQLENLISTYNKYKSEDDFVKLAYLHARYEHIHPFQDYNGRTGRLLLFRESLLLTGKPVVINNKEKSLYVNILKKCHDTNETDIKALKELGSLLKVWSETFYNEVKGLVIQKSKILKI